MKAKTLISCLLVWGLVGLGFSTVQAQEMRRGTAGATELLVPVTARTAAFSMPLTSGLAGVNPLDAMVSNPAGLTSGEGTSALFSRTEYVADIGINYFGAAQSFGNNTIALTVNAWDFGDIPKTTEVAPEVTEISFSASNTIVGLGFARQFTDRIAAGVTFKVVSEEIDDVGASGVAFDAGMTYVAGESGLRFGVSLKNFGPKMRFDGTGLTRFVALGEQEPGSKQNAVAVTSGAFELPSQMNVGVAYTRELGSSANATVLGNFSSNSFTQDEVAGGLELGLLDVLYVRGGFTVMDNSDYTFYETWNLGAGLNLEYTGRALTFDYAYRPTEFFKDVNMFTVGVTL